MWEASDMKTELDEKTLRGLLAWQPPPDASPLFGDSPRLGYVPKRFQEGPPWRWYHRLDDRIGCWLESIGRRMRGWAP